MENNQTGTRPGCGAGMGTLPPCAYLANPYVPFQCEGSEMYRREEALASGTLFPALDLPFRLKESAAALPQNPSSELQALEFVLTELALYLDTHQNDREAFQLYRQYAKLAEEGKARYAALYGPLTHLDGAATERYEWLNDPWPWEYRKEGGKR